MVPVLAEAPISPSFHPKDRRLSVKKVRELVGSSCQLSDEQLKAMRDQIYALAELLISGYVKVKNRDYNTAAELGAPLIRRAFEMVGDTGMSATQALRSVTEQGLGQPMSRQFQLSCNTHRPSNGAVC
jgi:hypothetical protein